MTNLKPEISSITVGPRQSNIELLRILAMFLVLVVHATFYATGVTTIDDFNSDPVAAFTKVSLRSLSIVCVNVFVLISGWFGIKASVKGLTGFAFQCGFLIFGIYAFCLITGIAAFSFKGLAGCLCLTNDYWFVTAYTALYLLSPILNSFIEKASKRQYGAILAAFFIFQTIWGWLGNLKFISAGYSCFSFIGLYLLARYVRLHSDRKSSAFGALLYILCALLNTVAYYCCSRLGVQLDIYAYVSPLVIAGSLGLLLLFANIRIPSNKAINWVAKSAFAVYLLHCNPNIMEKVFKTDVLEIYQNASGIGCLAEIFVYLIIVFCISIVIDQPRKWCWKVISRRLFNKTCTSR